MAAALALAGTARGGDPAAALRQARRGAARRRDRRAPSRSPRPCPRFSPGRPLPAAAAAGRPRRMWPPSAPPVTIVARVDRSVRAATSLNRAEEPVACQEPRPRRPRSAARTSRRAPACATTAPASAAATSRCRSTPRRTWDDYDAIRWYLAHGQTLVYVDKGTWYLLVMTRCKYLAARQPLRDLPEPPQDLPRIHDRRLRIRRRLEFREGLRDRRADLGVRRGPAPSSPEESKPGRASADRDDRGLKRAFSLRASNFTFVHFLFGRARLRPSRARRLGRSLALPKTRPSGVLLERFTHGLRTRRVGRQTRRAKGKGKREEGKGKKPEEQDNLTSRPDLLSGLYRLALILWPFPSSLCPFPLD